MGPSRNQYSRSILTEWRIRKAVANIWEALAGPVGFEPTILGSLHPDLDGSEGPRLSPGSTTGPARSFLARRVLLFSMMLVFFRRPTATLAETGGHARPDFSVPTTSLDASKGRLQDEFTTEQECGLEKVEPHSLLELYFEKTERRIRTRSRTRSRIDNLQNPPDYILDSGPFRCEID